MLRCRGRKCKEPMQFNNQLCPKCQQRNDTEAEKIVLEVSGQFGIAPIHLCAKMKPMPDLSPAARHALSQATYEVVRRLRGETELSLKDIGRMLNRSHSTIAYLQRQLHQAAPSKKGTRACPRTSS